MIDGGPAEERTAAKHCCGLGGGDGGQSHWLQGDGGGREGEAGEV
jgi:hypothetical protein